MAISTQRPVPSPQTTLGYDPSLRTAIDGFERVVLQSAKQVRDYKPLLYGSKPWSGGDKKKQSTYPVYSGMQNGVTWGGTTVIPDSSLGYLFDVTATVSVYANGYTVSWDGQQWDLYGLGSKNAKELGLTLGHMRQEVLFDLFNAGFTGATGGTVGGEAIFSNTHGYDNRAGLTTTQDNLIAGGRTIDVLIAALVAGMTVRDPMGRTLYQSPKNLFCADIYAHEWRQIINVGMNLRSDTTNNERNPFMNWSAAMADNFVIPVPYAYLDDANYAWVTFGREDGDVGIYCHEPLSIRMLPPEKTDAHGVKQDGLFGLACWAEDWRGVVGMTS